MRNLIKKSISLLLIFFLSFSNSFGAISNTEENTIIPSEKVISNQILENPIDKIEEPIIDDKEETNPDSSTEQIIETPEVINETTNDTEESTVEVNPNSKDEIEDSDTSKIITDPNIIDSIFIPQENLQIKKSGIEFSRIRTISDDLSLPEFSIQTNENELHNIEQLFSSKNDIINEFHFKTDYIIFGLSITADIELLKQDSLIRVILVDINNNEFLVFETNSQIFDSSPINIEHFCEETCELNGIQASKIKIQTINSSIHIKEIHTNNVNQKIIKSSNLSINDENLLGKQQRNFKIQRIQEFIKKNKLLWEAGETSFSIKSYEDKKRMFGGKIPNLYGFDYYKGGIFELPKSKQTKEKENNKIKTENINESTNQTLSTDEENINISGRLSYPDVIDWRNYQGSNWNTEIRNQEQCGSCWAFGAIGATEAIINTYYNQHINLDLSEQDLVSCSGKGDCDAGGFPQEALDYIKSDGVVNETCFPYTATNNSCENKCSNPSEIIKITEKSDHDLQLYELKESIYKYGPLSSAISSLMHAMALVGYDINSETGETVWIYKNSWGTGWGEFSSDYAEGIEDGGYARVKIDDPDKDIVYTNYILSPITTMNSYTIQCNDFDNDGYCYWGTSKIDPKTCNTSCARNNKGELLKDEDDTNSSIHNLFDVWISGYNYKKNIFIPIKTPIEFKVDVSALGNTGYTFTKLLNVYMDNELIFNNSDPIISEETQTYNFNWTPKEYKDNVYVMRIVVTTNYETQNFQADNIYEDTINVNNIVPINLNSSINENLEENENDYFSFETNKSGQITVYTSSDIDTYGYLEDENGETLTSNDDYNFDSDFRFTYTISPGTYYIKVRGYNGSESGPYTLTNEFVESIPKTIQEINNASTVYEMRTALEENKSELELDMEYYDLLSEDQKNGVAEKVLNTRPEDGYKTNEDIKNSFDTACNYYEIYFIDYEISNNNKTITLNFENNVNNAYDTKEDLIKKIIILKEDGEYKIINEDSFEFTENEEFIITIQEAFDNGDKLKIEYDTLKNHNNEVWHKEIEIEITPDILSPENLLVTDISTSIIKVKWEDISNNEDGFELIITPTCIGEETCNDNERIIELEKNSTSYSINCLEPNTSYNIEIKAYAVSAQDTSQKYYSLSKSFFWIKTLERGSSIPPKLDSASINNISSKDAFLRWEYSCNENEANYYITHYNVYLDDKLLEKTMTPKMREKIAEKKLENLKEENKKEKHPTLVIQNSNDKKFQDKAVKEYNSTTNTYMYLENLEANTKYNVKITAVNDIGESEILATDFTTYPFTVPSASATLSNTNFSKISGLIPYQNYKFITQLENKYYDYNLNNKFKISDSDDINVENGFETINEYLIYINNENINKIKNNGEEYTLISKDNYEKIQVMDEYIYADRVFYVENSEIKDNYDYYYQIVKMDTNGNNFEILKTFNKNQYIRQLLVSNNSVYYKIDDYHNFENNGLYKMNNDGTNSELIIDGDTYKAQIFDNKITYLQNESLYEYTKEKGSVKIIDYVDSYVYDGTNYYITRRQSDKKHKKIIKISTDLIEEENNSYYKTSETVIYKTEYDFTENLQMYDNKLVFVEYQENADPKIFTLYVINKEGTNIKKLHTNNYDIHIKMINNILHLSLEDNDYNHEYRYIDIKSINFESEDVTELSKIPTDKPTYAYFQLYTKDFTEGKLNTKIINSYEYDEKYNSEFFEICLGEKNCDKNAIFTSNIVANPTTYKGGESSSYYFEIPINNKITKSDDLNIEIDFPNDFTIEKAYYKENSEYNNDINGEGNTPGVKGFGKIVFKDSPQIYNSKEKILKLFFTSDVADILPGNIFKFELAGIQKPNTEGELTNIDISIESNDCEINTLNPSKVFSIQSNINKSFIDKQKVTIKWKMVFDKKYYNDNGNYLYISDYYDWINDDDLCNNYCNTFSPAEELIKETNNSIEYLYTVNLDETYLNENTKYYYKIKSYSENNQTISSIFSFKTQNIIDPEEFKEDIISSDGVYFGKSNEIKFAENSGKITLKSDEENPIVIELPSGLIISSDSDEDTIWDGFIEAPKIQEYKPEIQKIIENVEDVIEANVITLIKVGSITHNLEFSKSIPIKIPVNNSEPGTSLFAYYSHDDGNSWYKYSPNISCTVDSNKICTFFVNHFSDIAAIDEVKRSCNKEDWEYSEWSECSNFKQKRTANKKNSCTGDTGKPEDEERTCGNSNTVNNEIVYGSGGTNNIAILLNNSPFILSNSESDKSIQIEKELDLSRTEGKINRSITIKNNSNKIEIDIQKDTIIKQKNGDPYKGILELPKLVLNNDLPIIPNNYQNIKTININTKDNSEISFSKPFIIKIPVVFKNTILENDLSIHKLENNNYQLLDKKVIIPLDQKYIIIELDKSGIYSILYNKKVSNNITRYEIVKLAIDAFNIEKTINNYSSFSDIPKDDLYNIYVNTAILNGIINGYPDQTFKPEKYVNRAEALKIIFKAAGIENPQGFAPYTDINKNNWFYQIVGYAYENEIISRKITEFEPDKPVTKDEVIGLITKIQKHIAKSEKMFNNIKQKLSGLKTKTNKNIALVNEELMFFVYLIDNNGQILIKNNVPVECQYSLDNKTWKTYGEQAFTNNEGKAECIAKLNKPIKLFLRGYSNEIPEKSINEISVQWE